ncbi:MAG: ATP cone domain-containing protein [Patescibacteria group bacterium]|jgi:hypothetical protein
MSQTVNVIKATGEIEPFSERKVIDSLLRAGASKPLADRIIQKVKPHLYPNIPTFEIYATVMKILKKEQRELADKYNLKASIMELGPSGYPFEKFIAGVLEAHGYKTQTNQVIMGKCVSHEVDVVAEKAGEKFMIECKFHNQGGGRTDIKDALYTYARFLDLQDKGFDTAWLMTNTKATSDVRNYGLCVGINITSWNYPDGNSLRELVDKSGLTPITSLTSLSKTQKQELLERGIIFSKDLPVAF